MSNIINKELDLFHFDEDRPNFDSYSKQNGQDYWLASEFMVMLGYEKFSVKMACIQKALKAAVTAGIMFTNHFIPMSNGDYKVTRTFCFLIAMNSDVKKANVAKAQLYFAHLANWALEQMDDQNENMERLFLRNEIKNEMKLLNSVAQSSGVFNFALFQDAGYQGMYNMRLSTLRSHKGFSKETTLFDVIGSEELGANIFRVTQTKAMLERDQTQGQQQAEAIAKKAGKSVRDVMIKNGGTLPEDLPLATNSIQQVQSKLKKASKALNKIDHNKKE